MAVKKGLGKGLDALFLDNSTKIESSGAQLVKITEIEPNRNQPRKDFAEDALMQLADSIREHGLIQPILVRPLDNGYQIIAGERRWRASRMAGITEVPVIVKDYDDTKTMEIALIENLQREDLNVMEEALGYQDLMENYSMTQDQVSKSVGKSRSAVANCLRLLNLPDEVTKLVKSGELSSGHARALLSLQDADMMIEYAKLAIKKDWTVRDIEKAVKDAQKEQGVEKKSKMRDSFFDEIELALKEEAGRVVKVKNKQDGKGIIEIEYFDVDDLKEIAKKLSK